MIRRFFGTIFLLLLVLGVYAYHLSTAIAPAPNGSLISEQTEDQAMDRLKREVKAQDADDPFQPSIDISSVKPTNPITLKFAEGDINTELETNKDIQGQMKLFGAKAATVHLEQPNIVQVTAWIRTNGTERQIDISGKLIPTPTGGIGFTTQSTEVGNLPIPTGILQGRLDKDASNMLAQVVPLLPIKVTDISVADGNLVLTGIRKPETAAN